MSTPAKKSSYSYTGHTTIHGRVVIERRRSLEADKNEKNRRMILVDATFYLHNTERTTADSLPCIFKYFQQSDDEFNEKNDPEVFDISANVSV